jgi:hypothetical protein
MKNLVKCLCLFLLVSVSHAQVRSESVEIIREACSPSNFGGNPYRHEEFRCLDRSLNSLISRLSLKDSYPLRLIQDACKSIRNPYFKSDCYILGLSFLERDGTLGGNDLVKILCSTTDTESRGECLKGVEGTRPNGWRRQVVRTSIHLNNFSYSVRLTSYSEKCRASEEDKIKALEQLLDECNMIGLYCESEHVEFAFTPTLLGLIVMPSGHVNVHACSLEARYNIP